MISRNKCYLCYEYLHGNYINCYACKVPICMECFSKGIETVDHKNNHSYQVNVSIDHIVSLHISSKKYIRIFMKIQKQFFQNLEVELFETGWTGSMELDLLTSINNDGYGNWSFYFPTNRFFRKNFFQLTTKKIQNIYIKT